MEFKGERKLFEECVEALGEGTIIMSEEASASMIKEMINVYPFTSWGKIDWEQMTKKHKINNVNGVLPALKSCGLHVEIPIYILWSGNHPVLQTTLQQFINAMDDVLAVDFDTYVYCPSHYVIEFYHEGDITLSFS
ncbi:hypothetical protein LJK88_43740 [Paenibacillus sp. P26]|nr:hypothetical protein LJK88_43740 [Paenibacillus sp. P26]